MAKGANIRTEHGAVIALAECAVCAALLGDSAAQDKHAAWHGESK